MLHLFFGHEDRAEAGTTAFLQSVIATARSQVALVPITRFATLDYPEGSNAFTFRRFLVPWIMKWEGWAVFMDGADMLLRDDVCALRELFDPYKAVMVVKHDYRTKHPRKYRGSSMESDNADYERKNWASVMAINCAHFAWRQITPEFVRGARAMDLLQLRFIPDDRIGALPPEWNWLVDEHGRNDAAKVLHFTSGIPIFQAHADAPMAQEWNNALLAAVTSSAARTDAPSREDRRNA
jgi:hypothetical protein